MHLKLLKYIHHFVVPYVLLEYSSSYFSSVYFFLLQDLLSVNLQEQVEIERRRQIGAITKIKGSS
jgi:hypothetical protein